MLLFPVEQSFVRHGKRLKRAFCSKLNSKPTFEFNSLIVVGPVGSRVLVDGVYVLSGVRRCCCC